MPTDLINSFWTSWRWDYLKGVYFRSKILNKMVFFSYVGISFSKKKNSLQKFHQYLYERRVTYRESLVPNSSLNKTTWSFPFSSTFTSNKQTCNIKHNQSQHCSSFNLLAHKYPLVTSHQQDHSSIISWCK